MKKLLLAGLMATMAAGATAQIDYTAQGAATPFKTIQQLTDDLTAAGATTPNVTTVGPLTFDANGRLWVLVNGNGNALENYILIYNLDGTVYGYSQDLDAQDTTGGTNVRAQGFTVVGTTGLIPDFAGETTGENAVKRLTVDTVPTPALVTLATNFSSVDLNGIDDIAPFDASTAVFTRGANFGGNNTINTIDIATGTLGATPYSATVATGNDTMITRLGNGDIVLINRNAGTCELITNFPATPTSTNFFTTNSITPPADINGVTPGAGNDEFLISSRSGAILIWNGTAAISYTFPDDGATAWSSNDRSAIAGTSITANQFRVFVSSFNANAPERVAIQYVDFGAASVSDWAMF